MWRAKDTEKLVGSTWTFYQKPILKKTRTERTNHSSADDIY
jgi:hypothetical protein